MRATLVGEGEVVTVGSGGNSEPTSMRPCVECGKRHHRQATIPRSSTRWFLTCSGHRRTVRPKEPCMNFPMPGLAVCRMHGGSSDVAREAGQRRVAMSEATAELVHLGGQLDVDPSEAMLAMVREAAWNVALYRRLVQLLRIDPDDPPEDMDEGEWADRVAAVAPDWQLASIAGRLSPADWKTGPHALVKMYDDERDKLMKWSKMCRDAGVDERMARVAEQAGSYLVRAIDVLIPQLQLTPQQEALLPSAMGRVIDVLEAGELKAPATTNRG
jgi:hypothetical protein